MIANCPLDLGSLTIPVSWQNHSRATGGVWVRASTFPERHPSSILECRFESQSGIEFVGFSLLAFSGGFSQDTRVSSLPWSVKGFCQGDKNGFYQNVLLSCPCALWSPAEVLHLVHLNMALLLWSGLAGDCSGHSKYIVNLELCFSVS